MAATVHLIGITFYGIFASGELQPWAEPPGGESEDLKSPPPLMQVKITQILHVQMLSLNNTPYI